MAQLELEKIQAELLDLNKRLDRIDLDHLEDEGGTSLIPSISTDELIRSEEIDLTGIHPLT